MITKYTFGKPFNTEAVITLPSDCKTIHDSITLPFAEIQTENLNKPKAFAFNINLNPNDMIFGLGQNLGGINKRGRKYSSFCTDDPNHTEEKKALYGAHNFFLIFSPEKNNLYGVFIDYPGLIEYDIAFTKNNLMTVELEQADLDIYYISPENNNPFESVVSQFREIIGKSYIPPFWAFGFMQSRWGYGKAEDLEKVYENHKKYNIPLDAIFLDIDYMQDFRDFTVNKENFKDFPATIKKFKEKNIHIVPIIDAGIKVSKDDPVDKEGIEKGFFCKKNDGSLLAAGVWPGLSHFTDYLNPEARKWFGSNYKELTDAGIDGFWNDMNEPAFFYSEDGLKEAFTKIKGLINDENPNFHKTWDIKDTILNVQNSEKDYKSFYHLVPEEYAGNFSEGKEKGYSKVNHYKIHNLYGYNMTRAASEFFTKNVERKILLISRASYIGMHRYSGIWTGDNASWWSHLSLLIKQLPGLSMCGFLYSGCDLGGFGCDTSRDLLLRFLSLGLFTPLMRNHSALGTREQECYQFENPEDFSGIIQFRYRLLPYLWKVFNDCVEKNRMYFKPLCFDFPDDKIACQIEDQLLLGDDLMIAPVVNQNAKGRTVYLPEDMTCITCGLKSGLDTGKPEKTILSKGLHYIDVPLNKIVFFIRKGKEISVVKSAHNSSELDLTSAEIWK